MSASGYRPSQSLLGHRPWFCLGTDHQISGEGDGQLPKKIVQGKLVRKKSYKRATTKKNASIGQKKVLQPQSNPKRKKFRTKKYPTLQQQHFSRDQTVGQNVNEGATSHGTMWQTENCRYTSSVFIKALQANKIVSKNKKNYPTYKGEIPQRWHSGWGLHCCPSHCCPH